jgi:UDP-glucose 4-epimerase
VTGLVGKRVLVTGGAGFVGSHIVELLANERCHGIVAVDNFVRGHRANLESALTHPNVFLVEGDIRDRHLMRKLIGATDVVFHQAALRITHCAAEPREAFDTMVDATFELARMCGDAGIEKMIYASSASIYGMAHEFPTSERHSGHEDRTLYGAAKLFGEGVLRALGVPHIALRYFNVYGPRMDIYGRYTEVLVRWMERIDAGLPPVIFGDGMQTMDLINVCDVARANLLAAKSDVTDQAFNLASGHETSLLQLAQQLAAVMERPSLVPVFQEPRSVNAVERRLADVEKARRLLGFAPEIPLHQGLLDLVDWWRATRRSMATVAEHRITL